MAAGLTDWKDILVLGIYFVFVLAVGIWVSKQLWAISRSEILVLHIYANSVGSDAYIKFNSR